MKSVNMVGQRLDTSVNAPSTAVEHQQTYDSHKTVNFLGHETVVALEKLILKEISHFLTAADLQQQIWIIYVVTYCK